MSGPKRATYRFEHDPTPTRVADLEFFAAKQEAWLERHGQFIRRELGQHAFEEAKAAYGSVCECIALEDPDTGFDCYGSCWATLNSLHRQASRAKRERQRQEQRRHQRVADALLHDCRRAWESTENQALLQRWAGAAERHTLEADLQAIASGSAQEVRAKAKAWLARFEETVRSASRSAQGNAKAVQACVPRLNGAVRALGELNANTLPAGEQEKLQATKSRLQQAAEEALRNEELEALRSAIRKLKRLATKYRKLIGAAELQKAAEVWGDALKGSGYAVNSRTEQDGTVVLQATSFPMKSVNVELKPGAEEVQFEVNGSTGHGGCAQDVQALQAELARRGMTVTVTDWGKGRPGLVGNRIAEKVHAGGSR